MNIERFWSLPLCTLVGKLRTCLHIVSVVVILRNRVCDNRVYQSPQFGAVKITEGQEHHQNLAPVLVEIWGKKL